MYIKSFRVKNFMIHQDTRIDLPPLTVLVGPNGGGKSALFDAMLNFSMLSRGNLRQAFGPYPYSFRATRYRAASIASRIGFEIIMAKDRESEEAMKYEISYAQTGAVDDQPTFMIFDELLTRLPDDTVLFDRSDLDSYPIAKNLTIDNDRSVFSAIRIQQSINASGTVDPLLDYLTQQISRFNRFRLDPAALATPCRQPDLTAGTVPRIGYHGEDLSATLYYLAETMHQSYIGICDMVRELVPEFDSFEFSNVGPDRVVFSLRYADRRDSVPSVRLSSGMLIFIGLVVLVSTPNRPPVLMIEEPENGLTPQAVKAFYKAVRKLAFNDDAEHKSQVLISSHSPFVICEAWNGNDREFIHQVQVRDGRAVVRKFSAVVSELGIHLARDAEGKRNHLSLSNAEDIMSGYLS